MSSGGIKITNYEIARFACIAINKDSIPGNAPFTGLTNSNSVVVCANPQHLPFSIPKSWAHLASVINEEANKIKIRGSNMSNEQKAQWILEKVATTVKSK